MFGLASLTMSVHVGQSGWSVDASIFGAPATFGGWRENKGEKGHSPGCKFPGEKRLGDPPPPLVMLEI